MFLEEMTKHGIMKDIEGIELQQFDTSPNRDEQPQANGTN